MHTYMHIKEREHISIFIIYRKIQDGNTALVSKFLFFLSQAHVYSLLKIKALQCNVFALQNLYSLHKKNTYNHGYHILQCITIIM